MTHIWPILLIAGSNTVYHIIAKSTPSHVSPYASLVVTYLTGAIAAFLLLCFTEGVYLVPQQFKQVNWTGYALGIAIIGLEIGNIFLYRVGWNISIGSLVANILLAVCLVAVGTFLYQEMLGIKQVIGILLCLGGLVLINLK